MISVIVPTFNAARTIDQQLEALAAQTYRGPWELIIADNGSTDATLGLVDRWRQHLPQLRVVDASSRPGAGAARNIGAAAARGSALAFCDADDVVDPGWLEALADALNAHHFVGGAIDHHTLNPGERATWHWNSHVTAAPLGLCFLPYALSANLAVTRDAFDAAGGFPEDLGGVRAAGDDMELSWRLQLAGHDLHFEPRAVVAYRHRDSLRAVWRQHVAYGTAGAFLYRRFRPLGVPRHSLLRGLYGYVKLLTRLPDLLHPESRGELVRQAAHKYGQLRGSFRARVLFI